MTDVIKDVQKQVPGSEHIELYELEIGTNSYAYFHSGLEADSSTIQFRDYSSPGTIRTYTALPLQFENAPVNTQGSSPRPLLTVANILSTFSDSLGGITNEDLLGKKLYRRTTLYKYAYGQSGDSNPPVEFPRQMWIIDRIAEKTKIFIKFELASPFDLAGVQLPRRTVMGGRCSWRYQGASQELDRGDRVGGCNWNTYGRTNDTDGTVRTVYFNKKDEEVVSSSATFNTNVASITTGFYYRTDKTGLTEIKTDGSFNTGQSAYDYWQAVVTTSSPGTPSDNNYNFRRVRVYDSYSASSTYKAYTDPNYNAYVTHDRGTDDAHARLWQVKTTTQYASAHNSTPTFNSYWTIGDQCSKTITGCSRRFKSKFATIDSSVRRKIDEDSVFSLPYGGFPGSRKLK
tara:strand:- start:6271 stop:7473 length:1203 start_codon:yes stop_codon:yes gene_type:complete